MKNLRKCIIEKLKNGYLPVLFLYYYFICGVASFTIFADYNEKLVVSNKSLSLKAPAISVDKKQPHRGVL